MRILPMLAAALLAAGCSSTRPTIAVVGAHPDDLEGGLGTYILLSGKYEIHSINYTRGEGGCGEQGAKDGSTARTRVAEELAVTARLGGKSYFLDEKNVHGPEAAATPRETVAKMAEILAAVKPRAVFLHWPLDTHDDHVMCYAACIKALHLAKLDPEIYFYEEEGETQNLRPRHWVDITDVIERRRELIRLYACQNENDGLVKEKDFESARRGREMSPPVKYAEAFGVFRNVPAGTPTVFDDIPRRK